MNAAEMKNIARNNTIGLLSDILAAVNAVQFGDASFAILQNVDGQDIWTEISVKTKAYKATKVSPAFDPERAAKQWQAEKEEKALAKEQKAMKNEG